MAEIPTLDDVARAAGVSTATVSRCLNNGEVVTEATRKKVMTAVDMLGYTPNFGARAMAAKRTFVIGAIVPTMENAIFARGLQAFQERLQDKGYTLLVSSNGYQPAREAELVKALVSRGAEGLLLIGYERDSEVDEFLDRRGVPALLAWAHREDEIHPAVGFDNRDAMRQLTEIMIARGHHSIAVISGMLAGNDRASARLAGIFDAVAAAGMNQNAVHVIETPYGISAGAAAFKTLMETADRPELVMCGNDVLAAGALTQAHDMGLDVPGDISITGFDDIELARVVHPALTTVAVPHREMGEAAADALVTMIEDKVTTPPLKLDVEFKLRGSTR